MNRMNSPEDHALRYPYNLGPPIINSYQANPYGYMYHRGHQSDYAETNGEDAIMGNALPISYLNAQNWNVNPPPPIYKNNHSRSSATALVNHFNPLKSLPSSAGPEFRFRQKGQENAAAAKSLRQLQLIPTQNGISSISKPRKPVLNKAIAQLECGDKHRKVNPLMAMLPPPDRRAKITPNKKNEEEIVRQDPSRSTHQFYPTRILSGSIDDILKWSSVSHKCAPLYETIGQLSDYDSSTQYHSESRFILQNISQLHKERGPKTKLNCTYFAMDRAFEIFPIGTVIRCVGRFYSNNSMDLDRVFQCVSIRRSLDVDLVSLSENVKHPSNIGCHSTQNEHWQEEFAGISSAGSQFPSLLN